MAVRNSQSVSGSSGAGGGIDLGGLLRQGVTLQSGRVALLKEGLAKGTAFFENYNESRVKLTFSYFDQPMREAFFEIAYLLHMNTPDMAKMRAIPAGDESTSRAADAEVFNLYSEGAPAGVAGIDRLSPVFRQNFLEYTRKVFGNAPAPLNGTPPPVVTLQSIGSIGTVGHKSSDSDLDLQVIYNLTPPLADASSWSNDMFLETLHQEQAWWIAKLPAMKKIPPEKVADPAIQEQIRASAYQQLVAQYPYLHGYLVSRTRDFATDLASSEGGVIRSKVLHELVALIKRAGIMSNEAQTRKQEAALKARVNKIEAYVAKRFPDAEVHLFTYPIVGFRLGRYSSTIESKESSGSAYELLLNYETLMPGIHLTPMMPTHFIFPALVNNDAALYARLMDYLTFNLIDLYRDVKATVVDLGHTPNVEPPYVAQHSGAMYWEAFKASSGNLPKATLNLLRYEMMLEPRMLKTNIQLIKEPGSLDTIAAPKPENTRVELESLKLDLVGLPSWAVLELEIAYPYLKMDPWWLRYKALKLGFGEEQGVPGLDKEERAFVSRVTDLAFALHVRISDVFTKPGDKRPFDSPREKVLVAYLAQAFPPGSPRRSSLEQIFIGEVEKVNAFEHDLRSIFKRCMARVTKKIAAFKLPDRGWKREEDLWYQFYLSNFDPPPNVVLRTIMNHLRVPRGRLQVGFKQGEGWFFRSLQKESTVGKRFDTFGTLNHLPETVMLLEKSGFLAGLGHCIINGYVGVVDKGTLRERRTELEFDGKHMNMGHNTDNTLAYVRPDMVHRMVARIEEFFPPQHPNYMDFITKSRKVTGVFAFLNLWHFGMLSLLYRDNLNTWFCDEIDHPAMTQAASAMSASANAMLQAKPIHNSLAAFFKQKGLYAGEFAFAGWVNPNSVVTNHAAGQDAAKEKQLATEFERLVAKLHRKEGPYSKPAAIQAATPSA